MIYILEDDLSIRKLISYTLNKENYETKDFELPSEFFEGLKTQIPDLILLDIMLPEKDGLTILKELKLNSLYKDIPIIMLTAKSSEFDKVTGLDNGADDYIAKPFGMMELVSRIKAVLRRYKKDDNLLVYKNLILDKNKHKVIVNNEEIILTLKEFDLLSLLLSSINICHTRDEILETIWGYEYDNDTRTVDVHIRTLRTKLKSAGEYIKTIRGLGYKIGD